MSLATLLTQELTILRHTPGAEDQFGEAADGWVPDAETVRGRLEPQSAEEITLDRQTVVADWLLFLHKDVVILPRDRVADGFGRTFEVLSAAMQATPRGDSHLEVKLQHFA